MSATWKALLQDVRVHLPAYIITFAGYLAVSQLATIIYRDIGTQPSLIFAPQGVSLAAMFIVGYGAAVPIAIAVIVNTLINGTPLLIAASAVIFNVVQPVAGVYVLRRFGFDWKFSSLRDMMIFLSVAAATAMIVPTSNVVATQLYNYLYEAGRVFSWVDVWIGGLVSIIAMTPFLVRWLAPMSKRTKLQWLEGIISVSALSVISYFLFATVHVTVFGISLLFALFVPLFWIALRCGPRFMTLAIFLMTMISIVGVLLGEHPPSPTNPTLAARAFSTALFDLLMAVFFLILVAIEEQRKEAMRALRAHTERLSSAYDTVSMSDEAKNDYIAILGHELRNPLASLMNTMEIMRVEKKQNPEHIRMLDSMNDRIYSMARILDDILDISRITRHKLTLKKVLMDPNEVVRKACDAVELYMKKQGHHFEMKPLDQRVALHADPTRVEQVVMNLLYNSAKYTPPGGLIELRMEYDSPYLLIHVRDTGVGISKETMEKIFDPFVQINPRQTFMGGIGLGLTLAKNLTELHGGSISVKSEGIGKGSEFTLRFPAQLVNAPIAPPPPKPVASSTNLGPLKVLVVDDNKDAASGMSKLLSIHGHTVESAHDGRDAVRKMVSWRAQVVLLDIGLPDMDGYEVAKKVQLLPERPVLIAISGYGQEEDKRKAESAGFDFFLTKPVSISDVLRVMNEARADTPRVLLSKQTRR